MKLIPVVLAFALASVAPLFAPPVECCCTAAFETGSAMDAHNCPCRNCDCQISKAQPHPRAVLTGTTGADHPDARFAAVSKSTVGIDRVRASAIEPSSPDPPPRDGRAIRTLFCVLLV